MAAFRHIEDITTDLIANPLRLCATPLIAAQCPSPKEKRRLQAERSKQTETKVRTNYRLTFDRGRALDQKVCQIENKLNDFKAFVPHCCTKQTDRRRMQASKQ